MSIPSPGSVEFYATIRPRGSGTFDNKPIVFLRERFSSPKSFLLFLVFRSHSTNTLSGRPCSFYIDLDLRGHGCGALPLTSGLIRRHRYWERGFRKADGWSWEIVHQDANKCLQTQPNAIVFVNIFFLNASVHAFQNHVINYIRDHEFIIILNIKSIELYHNY